MAVLNFKDENNPLMISFHKGNNIQSMKSSYITPVKKKRRLQPVNSTSSKYIESTPMMIRSVNTTAVSNFGSGKKTQREFKENASVLEVQSSSNTCIKSKKKLRRRFKYKMRTKSKLSQQKSEPFEVKRLNIRNKELHIEARPYTELKDYVCKKRE